MSEENAAKKARFADEPVALFNSSLAGHVTAEQIRSLFTKPYSEVCRVLEQEEEENSPSARLENWLDTHGFTHLFDLFEQEEVDCAALELLELHDLLELGLNHADAQRLLAVISSHPPTSTSTSAPCPDPSNSRGAHNPPSTSHAEPPPAKQQSMMTDFFRGKDGQALKPRDPNLPPANPMKNPSKNSRIPRTGRGRARAQPPPFYKCVPGTTFVVDAFDADCSQMQTRSYFLTHFHTDHTKGLTSRFDRGVIYCTHVTARLLETRTKIPRSVLQPLPLNTPTVIEGVTVTLLDANHCPGAAMILFERPQQAPVLHCGDCRLTDDMRSCAVLQRIRGTAMLYLDTTYCDPAYAFPPQRTIIEQVVEAVRAEEFNTNSSHNAGTLFLFGTYTIGKERIFLEVAKALNRPIYVGPAKMEVMNCLDLTESERALLTTDEKSTNLQAVGMWTIRMQKMASLLRYYRGRFNVVVGVEPTGWSHGKNSNSNSNSKGGPAGPQAQGETNYLRKTTNRDRSNGTILQYSAPYSEHSSFTELKKFVEFLRPIKVVPTVGNDGPQGTKTMKMLRALGVA